jgi:hypothetical protein
MKEFDFTLMNIVNDYIDDYGVEGLLDELFPGQTMGELVVDMYQAGLIPETMLESFLNA